MLPPHLLVEREGNEVHGADVRDPGRHGVHDLELAVQPEALQLGEHVERLELLQVEDLGVGEPELLDKADVDGNPGVSILTFERQAGR